MTPVQPPSLRSPLYPRIRQWADRIEAHWHQYLDCSAYPLLQDRGYLEGRLEGISESLKIAAIKRRSFAICTLAAGKPWWMRVNPWD